MGLVKTNPQNELGDIISEPCVNFNRFRVIIQVGFFIVVQRVVQEWLQFRKVEKSKSKKASF
jgi:hypothetical protein